MRMFIGIKLYWQQLRLRSFFIILKLLPFESHYKEDTKNNCMDSRKYHLPAIAYYYSYPNTGCTKFC